MNLYLILRWFIPFVATLICFYICLQSILIYRQNPKDKFLIYFILALAIAAIGLLFYSMTPFIKEDQKILAEISLGGSFILYCIALIFCFQFWQMLYREVPWITKIFYLATGAGFVFLLYDPWKIYIYENLGFHQTVSFKLIVPIIIQGGCIFIILFKTVHTIRKKIDQEFVLTEKHQQKYVNSDTKSKSSATRRRNLQTKKKRLNLIIYSWLIGFFLAVIGLTLPNPYGFNLDVIGSLIIIIPQAYILIKDKELLFSLRVQKTKDKAIKLQESFFKLQQQVSHQILETEVQALVKFIEKADSLLYFQEEHNV
ncbi:MAG: hypothetical protein ACFFB5_10890 [Promethearchaeota archaeon]